MYLKNKKLIWVFSTVFVIILSSCGVQNNASFTATPGQCADGTTNAPYCMAIQLSNNSGGQNYINSTNYAFENLQISVNSSSSNLNYPVTQGSALDPNGCVNSTIKPGKSCTFYVQLTGESVPVGSFSPININASYKIDNNLFGGGSSTYSSSYSFYQKPNLVVTNTNGLVINYSQTGLQSAFSAESSGSVAVNANANDNYYGFLYLATNSGLFLSGNESFAYNKAESLTNINNITINGKTAYPISGGNIYSATINPIKNISWANFATASNNLKTNTAITALGRVVVASSNNVFICNSSSSSGGCVQEGVPLTGIQKLIYTVLGSSNSGSLTGVQLTGLVVGTSGGLFVESGVTNSSANQWLPVYVNNNPVVSNIVSMALDNLGDIFAIDSNGAIYKVNYSGGNTASLQDSLVAGSGAPIAITYDNAGSVLYVVTDSGNLYGCTNNGTHLDCSGAPVATNVFTGAAFGLNIITSLYTGSI